MIKIYIASSWKNSTRVIELADKLEKEGFEVDAFCRTSSIRHAFHWSDMVDNKSDLKKYDAIEMLNKDIVIKAFEQDKKWLDWANIIIMLMPCGRSSHMEGGYGVGSGKRLYMYGEFNKGEFDVMYGFAYGLFRTEEYDKLVLELKHYERVLKMVNNAKIAEPGITFKVKF